MATLDNPAGRLHRLLDMYRTAADTSKSITTTWCEVLEVDSTELPLVLCEVAGLVSSVDAAVAKADQPEMTAVFDQHNRAWALPVLTHGYAVGQTPSTGADLVDPGALVALGLLSAFLSQVYGEAKVPDSAEVDALRTQIQAAINSLRDSDDLPQSVRIAILSRLSDILWAMDHVHIGGPEAVAAATERLLGALIFLRTDTTKSTVQTVANLARFAWGIFMKAPEAHQSLDAWTDILKALPGGS